MEFLGGIIEKCQAINESSKRSILSRKFNIISLKFSLVNRGAVMGEAGGDETGHWEENKGKGER